MNNDEAVAMVDDMIMEAKEEGTLAELANEFESLGQLRLKEGDLEFALNIYKVALNCHMKAIQANDIPLNRYGLAQCMEKAADIHQQLGDIQETLSMLGNIVDFLVATLLMEVDNGIIINPELKHQLKNSIGWAFLKSAIIHEVKKDFYKAKDFYLLAIEMFERVGDVRKVSQIKADIEKIELQII